MTKACIKCGSDGPMVKDKRRTDGLGSYCTKCQSEFTKAWYKENKEHHHLLMKDWTEKNIDRRREITRNWAHAHPEIMADRQRKRGKENPQLIRDYARTRRARKRSSEGSFTRQEWEALKEDYCGRCAYCNKKSDELTADHVVSISRGGSSYIENIIPACLSCNSSKQATPLLAWMRRLNNE